jgi:hypothetical protein
MEKRLVRRIALLALMALLMVPAVASAASVGVTLYPTQYYVYTGAIGLSTFVDNSYTNASSSARDVYCYTQYSKPGYSWTRVRTQTVAPGNSSGVRVSQSTAGSWRMNLNPVGSSTRDCYCWGTLRY